MPGEDVQGGFRRSGIFRFERDRLPDRVRSGMQENVDGLCGVALAKRLGQDAGFLQRLNGRIGRPRVIVGAGRRDMNIGRQRNTAERHEQKKMVTMSHASFPLCQVHSMCVRRKSCPQPSLTSTDSPGRPSVSWNRAITPRPGVSLSFNANRLTFEASTERKL